MERQTTTTAKTDDSPDEKLAQWRLTRENPLFDWSNEMSDEELEISVLRLISALSWA